MTRYPESFPGLRVDGADLRGALLYDGDCGFCRDMAGRARRLARRPFVCLPFASVQDRLPAEALRTTEGQMLFVDSEGRLWGGSRALVRFLSHAGRPVLAALLGNPLVRPFTWLGYRLVASHRSRLIRCGNDPP